MKHSLFQSVRLAATWTFVWQLFTALAITQWSNNPNVNTAVSTLPGGQYYHTSISDGSGGVIIAWEDRRSLFADIYAQRISAAGVVQWNANGVAINRAANIQGLPTIAGDNAGGAIITWADHRNGNNNSDIYAQRVSASGVVQWDTNGVAICIAGVDQVAPLIISDGAGGAVIVWEDSRNDFGDIYAQRINASGSVQWTENGVSICTAANAQRSPVIVSDGAGGAVIAWPDLRDGASNDIYSQRVGASGSVQWAANGVAICSAINAQNSPTLAGDGAGGAIISWYDVRNGTNDIYAQRINASGGVQWTPDGVVISAAGGHQYYPTIISDGSSGAIITWPDRRTSFAYDIYAQRVNSSGLVQWTTDGVAISIAGVDHLSPVIVSDGTGGAIITWDDNRSGTSTNDIYAQRINASGAVQWTANGVAISTAPGRQTGPTIISDGAGGAIVAWGDSRNAVDNIYAQQISANGLPGVVTRVQNSVDAVPGPFRLDQNYPNPLNPATIISFGLPSQSFVSLKIFDALGREVSILLSEELSAGTHSREWKPEGLPTGVYFYRLQAGSFIGTKKLILLK